MKVPSIKNIVLILLISVGCLMQSRPISMLQRACASSQSIKQALDFANQNSPCVYSGPLLTFPARFKVMISGKEFDVSRPVKTLSLNVLNNTKPEHVSYVKQQVSVKWRS